MTDKKIKNLLFDFGGVLIDLDRQRCIDQFKALGMPEIEELLNVYHQQAFFLQLEKGEISSAAFCNQIRQTVSKQVTDEQINIAWNSFLLDIPAYKLDLLTRLREKYTVYLLSNTNEIHWKWALQNVFPSPTNNVENYFEKVYLSYEMKLVKPDPTIFTAVLEDAGIKAEETLFIDDSELNCQTAQQLGFTTYTPEAGEDWSHLFK